MRKPKKKKLRSWVEWWDYDGPLTKRTKIELEREEGEEYIQWNSLPATTQCIRSGTSTEVRYYETKKSHLSLHTLKQTKCFYYGSCFITRGPFARTSTPAGLAKFARLVESWGDSI